MLQLACCLWAELYRLVVMTMILLMEMVMALWKKSTLPKITLPTGTAT